MKFYVYLPITLLTLLLFNVTGHSQIYPLQHYSTENGIATRGVFDITQDKTGRMWFATGIGISSYDGFSWTNYGEEQGVPKHKYSRILCGEDGTMWAAPGSVTDNVIHFTAGKWERIELVPKSITTGGDVTGFGITGKSGGNVIMLTTYEGFYVSSSGKWERLDASNGLADNVISSSALIGSRFYIATQKGISVYEDGKIDNSINLKIPSGFGTVLKVAEAQSSPGRLWMFSNENIGYLEGDNFVTFNSGFSIPVKSSLDYFYITVSLHGEIYFGNVYSRNIFNSNSGELRALGIENGFSSEGNTSAFIDREDNIWFSDYKGIDKINTLAFRNHSTLNGLGENDVSAIAEIEPGVFAFGHNAGISFLKNYHFRYISFENLPGFKMYFSRVLDFYRDRNGNTWFAAMMLGAGLIDSGGNIKWFKVKEGVGVMSINEDKYGNLIAACSDGIYELKNGAFEKIAITGSQDIQCRRFFDFGEDFLWGASSVGIFRLTGKDVKFIKNSGGFSEKSSYAVFKDDDGTTFAGTEKGLYEIVNDSLVKFSRGGFEINDPVYAITKDRKSGYLWFGTGVNLIGWNGSDNIKKFNSLNGLVKGEISRAGLYLDSRNTLWVGTDAGLSRYIPSLDYGNIKIPVPVILGVEDYLGNKYSPDEEISVDGGNTALKFKVRGISFVSEKLMEYRIKLDGYDKDWVIIGQEDINNIEYKNLQPGNYRFRMSVRNFSGEWSPEITGGEIKIKGAFYTRWWFILAAVILVIFNILYFYHRYMRRKYTKYLENKVRQRTSELEFSQKELKNTLASLEEKVEERTRELAESETKLRSIIEQASDGIAIYEIETRKLILVNPAYADMLNYTEEEMLRLTLYDVVAHDRDSIDHYIDNVVREDKILIKERYHRKKDGSHILVEVSINMIFYHDIEAMCVIIRDITERKKIQRALHESEKKFREIVELLPEAVYETDAYGKLTFVNKQGLKLFGYTEEDLAAGRSIIEIVAPEEREVAIKAMMETLSGKVHVGAKFTGLKKDGTRIPVYINKTPIFDGDKCLGIRGIAVDMRQQLIAEEILKQYADELKELNATKDKFFSIIAHDLRAPFTGFLGFSELLHQELDNLSKEEIRHFASVMKNSAKSNYELLENLLQWGRLQTGSLEIKNEKFEISGCVNNVLKLLELNIERKEIRVKNNIGAPVYASGDCNIVQSVIQNIITNSIKFTDRKGEINLNCGQEDGMIYISVKDNGVGIPEETMAKLFRLDSHITTQGTEKESGTGLGLLVCKEMVEKMNGRIEITSRVNEGTNVVIRLKAENDS